MPDMREQLLNRALSAEQRPQVKSNHYVYLESIHYHSRRTNASAETIRDKFRVLKYLTVPLIRQTKGGQAT